MTNEKPTPQEIESHHFDNTFVEVEFNMALQEAWQKLKEGKVKVYYDYHGTIDDADHLDRVTFVEPDGTVLYYEDIGLERSTREKN